MRDKPTISQVAKAAGVAASTVSRVLNGGYASADVKTRVKKITEQLGYFPSPTARNLKIGRTGIVGLVAETQGSWFHELLTGVEEELVEKRVSVALCSLRLTGTYDASTVDAWITERRVDGIIFVRATTKERSLVNLAQKMGLPAVFIAPDHTFRSGYTVRAQNRDAARDVAAHLLNLGHQTIAFAGGPEASLDSRDRLQGLRSEMADRGLSLDESHVSFGENYKPESGVSYAKRWLALPRNKAPTAVVLGNDEMALGFMRTVQAEGVRIPEDVSVVGFDGAPEGALYWPGLTTSAQPARKMGRAACKELFIRIEGQDPAEGASLEMAMELTVRESTGPGPRALKKSRAKRD